MPTTSRLERVRDLDWLALFIASWVVPFILDDFHRLTYFTSLAFWLVPTLLLLPRFLAYTDSGGRRRSAMLITTGAIVAMGVLLDVVFGHVILQFDESSAAYLAVITVPALGARVPVEEFLFYAMAPIATLLLYGWASEYWMARYTPRFVPRAGSVHERIIQISPAALLVGVILMLAGLAIYQRNPARDAMVPGYFTFLIALAFVPAVFLFSVLRTYVNWRAFGVTALYLLVTSMAWETTLAVPRHWWGYKPSGMLGIWVQAWTADPAWPFPLEAVLVWFASPFAMVLTYEFVKLKKYLADPAKATYMHPSLR